MVSYTSRKVGIPTTTTLSAILLASILAIVAWPLFGLLSDHVGRKAVLRMGAICVGLYAAPFLWLISTGSIPLLYLGIIVGWTLVGGMLNAVEPVFFAEAFPADIRYTGVSFGLQFAAALGGGLAPFIATAVLALAGHWWPVAVYIVLMALLSLLALSFAKETYKIPLDVFDDEAGAEPMPANRESKVA
ncbi:Fosfomycin resistance protein AbaF [Castellaniella defragrans]